MADKTNLRNNFNRNNFNSFLKDLETVSSLGNEDLMLEAYKASVDRLSHYARRNPELSELLKEQGELIGGCYEIYLNNILK